MFGLRETKPEQEKEINLTNQQLKSEETLCKSQQPQPPLVGRFLETWELAEAELNEERIKEEEEAKGFGATVVEKMLEALIRTYRADPTTTWTGVDCPPRVTQSTCYDCVIKLRKNFPSVPPQNISVCSNKVKGIVRLSIYMNWGDPSPSDFQETMRRVLAKMIES